MRRQTLNKNIVRAELEAQSVVTVTQNAGPAMKFNVRCQYKGWRSELRQNSLLDTFVFLTDK